MRNKNHKTKSSCCVCLNKRYFKRVTIFGMSALVIVVLSVFLIVFANGNKSYANESTLELVHVIFRHGDRTPTASELSRLNPYYNESFYSPYGYGQLTTQGIRTMYNTGQLLRQRYDNFLGTTWDIYKLHTRSTDRNRTMMSASVVLAGLWPPKADQMWHQELAWYPIPYEYAQASQDVILDPFTACSNSFWDELYRLLNVSDVNGQYEKTLKIMSENMGQNVTVPDAFVFYFGFKIQEEWGLSQEEWSKNIYPEPLISLVRDCYKLESGSTLMRRIMTGYHLKKMLEDFKHKINGTLRPETRKMFLYSAHDINLATFLLSTELYDVQVTPPYGSFISIELHKVQGVYCVKVVYQDYENSEPKTLKLPDCEEFCEFDRFYQLLENIIPEGDQECLGTN